MRRYHFLDSLFFMVFVHSAFTQGDKLFVASDFTEDGLFSNNIEGPAFDKSGELYVVNFQRDGTIGKVSEGGKVELYLTLPEGSIANSIQFDSKGTMFLADWTGHNVLAVNPETKEITVFVHSEAFNQPNDLCINSRDQLFVSDPNWQNSTGQIWRVDPDGALTLLDGSMGTTNGIELSPDEKILYVNESVQRKIWAFDVDEAGSISNKRLFAEFPDFGFDGMKCDKEGNLYVTRYGKGTVIILSRDGGQLREVQLKGKNCSNLVFGGKDGRTLFVTLQDRGSIEIFRVNISGKSHNG